MLDCDNDGEVATIEQSPDNIYYINKHSASKQIWMVSPFSGPQHFHIDEGEWTNSNGNTISDVLNDELAQYGIKIEKLSVKF